MVEPRTRRITIRRNYICGEFFALCFLIVAIVLTPFTVSYFRRINDFEPVQQLYSDIQLKQIYSTEQVCNGCIANMEFELPECPELQERYSKLSVVECQNGTGPCAPEMAKCQDPSGCCAAWSARSSRGHHIYCSNLIKINLCRIDTKIQYLANITFTYYNSDFNRTVKTEGQEIFDTLDAYRLFKTLHLGTTREVYYRKGNPEEILVERNWTDSEKAQIAFCFICWGSFVISLTSVIVCYLAAIRNYPVTIFPDV